MTFSDCLSSYTMCTKFSVKLFSNLQVTLICLISNNISRNIRHNLFCITKVIRESLTSCCRCMKYFITQAHNKILATCIIYLFIACSILTYYINYKNQPIKWLYLIYYLETKTKTKLIHHSYFKVYKLGKKSTIFSYFADRRNKLAKPSRKKELKKPFSSQIQD